MKNDDENLEKEFIDSEIDDKEEQPNTGVPYHYANSSNLSDKATPKRLQELANKPHYLQNNQIPNNDFLEQDDQGLEQQESSGVEEEQQSSSMANQAAGAIKGAVKEKGKQEATKAVISAVAKKKVLIVVAIVTAIVIFLIIILVVIAAFYNGTDESNTNEGTISYINGNMTNEELLEYLQYNKICTDLGTDYEDLTEEEIASSQTADCKYVIQFYEKIKEEYEDKRKACNSDNLHQKDINKPCGVELNIPLLLETLSYDKLDHELWNRRETPNQIEDIENLVSAMIEYVHESCYILVEQYRDKNGRITSEYCDGCTRIEPKKVNQDWYYFQVNFDKYVSFLKYGFTSTHPYYLNGTFIYSGVPPRNMFIAKNNKENIVQFGENHDHICEGQKNNTFMEIN